MKITADEIMTKLWAPANVSPSKAKWKTSQKSAFKV